MSRNSPTLPSALFRKIYESNRNMPEEVLMRLMDVLYDATLHSSTYETAYRNQWAELHAQGTSKAEFKKAVQEVYKRIHPTLKHAHPDIVHTIAKKLDDPRDLANLSRSSKALHSMLPTHTLLANSLKMPKFLNTLMQHIKDDDVDYFKKMNEVDKDFDLVAKLPLTEPGKAAQMVQLAYFAVEFMAVNIMKWLMKQNSVDWWTVVYDHKGCRFTLFGKLLRKHLDLVEHHTGNILFSSPWSLIRDVVSNEPTVLRAYTDPSKRAFFVSEKGVETTAETLLKHGHVSFDLMKEMLVVKGLDIRGVNVPDMPADMQTKLLALQAAQNKAAERSSSVSGGKKKKKTNVKK